MFCNHNRLYIHPSDKEFIAVVDPGFPVRGTDPFRGVTGLRHGRFLVKIYVKMKELGPVRVGGGGRAPGTLSKSFNALLQLLSEIIQLNIWKITLVKSEMAPALGVCS